MKKAILLCFLVFSAMMHSQTVVVDPTFNVGGTGVDVPATVTASLVLPDNKILIGGAFNSYNGVAVKGIARLNSDGSLDTTFNSGTGIGGGSALSIASGSDGKLYVVGKFTSFNGVSKLSIVRLNSDGSLDSTFAVDDNLFDTTSGTPEIRCIAFSGNDKIYIGGLFTANVPSGIESGLICLHADGSLNADFNITDFGTPVTMSPYTLIVLDDGSLLAGGQINYQLNQGIVKIKSTGEADFDFFSTLSQAAVFSTAFVQSISVEDDGQILIGGIFTVNNTVKILTKLNSNGVEDSSFNSFPAVDSYASNAVFTIKPYLNKFLVAGRFSSYGGAAINDMMLLNTDGSIDSAFNIGSGVDFYFNNVSFQSDGKIIAHGSFLMFNGQSSNSLVRLNNGNLSTAQHVLGNDILAFSNNGTLNFISYKDNISSIEIYDLSGKLLVKEPYIFSKEYNAFGLPANQVLISKVILANGEIQTLKTYN